MKLLERLRVIDGVKTLRTQKGGFQSTGETPLGP